MGKKRDKQEQRDAEVQAPPAERGRRPEPARPRR